MLIASQKPRDQLNHDKSWMIALMKIDFLENEMQCNY